MATVAELIAKLRVDGQAQFTSAMRNAESSFKRLEMVAGSAGQSIASSLTSPLNALIGLAGVGGLIGLAKYASNTSLEFDTLQRRLEGITESAGRAAEIMDFARKLAVPSIFETKELAESAAMLEAFRLQGERWLPVAEKITTAMFGHSNERLKEFISLLGRAKGGNLGEVFGPEGLGRFGLGRDVFKGMGLPFDRNGQFLGSIKQAMEAIEQVVNSRFDSIARHMQSGPAAKMASVWDAIQQSAKQAGDVINARFLPLLEASATALNTLNKNNFFGDLADSITRLLVPGLQAVVKHLESIQNTGFEKWLAKTLTILTAWGTVILVVIAAISLLTKNFGVAIAAIVGTLALNMAWLKAMNALRNSLKGKGKGMGGDNTPQIPLPNMLDQNRYALPDTPLQQVANNTRMIAKNTEPLLDFKRMALGGGELGRMGVTPVELAGFRNRQGREVTIRFEGSGLERHIAEMINRALRQNQTGWQI